MTDSKAFALTLLSRYEDTFKEKPDAYALGNALAELVRERIRDFLVSNTCHLADCEVAEVCRLLFQAHMNPSVLEEPVAIPTVVVPREKLEETYPPMKRRGRRKASV